MAIRLERSGGLIFIKGALDEPENLKGNKYTGLGLWLILILLLSGVLFDGPHVMSWPAVSHAFKAFLGEIW